MVGLAREKTFKLAVKFEIQCRGIIENDTNRLMPHFRILSSDLLLASLLK